MEDAPTLAAVAAWYADHKIPVFPCKPRGKAPITRHGFKEATTDQSKIDSWWRKCPNANIGVPTGAASGLLAVDIDPRNGGDDSLEELLAKHSPFPDTAKQLTGGGGRHIVFRHPGVSVVDRLAPGIDVKGEGGYIVVAPSLHQSGKRYQWEGIKGEEALLKPADAPDWLRELIAKAPAKRRAQAGAQSQPLDDGEKWRKGERNTRLASLAGALRNCGLTRTAMEAAMLEQNRERCDPPLDTREVQRISASIARYPAGNLTAFTPPGYDTAFDAFLDVVRFTADLPGFPVLLFHVERSLGYGKAATARVCRRWWTA